MKHFFISYNSADRAWAEWIAWYLDEAGYSTVIQAWDFRPGSNFVLEMHKATADTERTIAVLSPNYLGSLFTQPEWAAAFAQDPTGANGKLLPVRVRECELKGLLTQIVYIDLLGLDETAAKETLLSGVSRDRAKPKTAPKFPVTRGGRVATQPPRFPGALPAIWNVPHRRNPNFTGRENLLDDLRKALTAGHAAAVTQAISGLGGVGKTQLAAEYAYRFASSYDLVWWMRSEQTATLSADFAGLATPLNLPEKDLSDQNAIVAAVRRCLERQSGYLLIFDNAAEPADLRPFLPQGNAGHTLVTSRNPNWRGVAQPLSVKVLERQASVDFLLKRTGQKDEAAAAQLAEELGDLPLALEQAGAYIEETGSRIADYLKLFRSRHAELLKRRSASADYADTVATTWDLSFAEVLKTAPAAVDLLNLFAFLAPDNIPRELLSHKDALNDSLKTAVEDGLMLDHAVAALRKYSLLEATGEAFSVHRLVQAVVRERLSDDERKSWAEIAVLLVHKAFPMDGREVGVWPICSRLLPHALISMQYANELKVIHRLAGHILNKYALYLYGRAQFSHARDLLEQALVIDEATYGLNHPHVATRVNYLGLVLKQVGDNSGARLKFERALEIAEAVYGSNHPSVAQFRNNLGSILMAEHDYVGAKQQFEQALRIAEKEYGPNNHKVSTILIHLGKVLNLMGDMSGSQQLFERALTIDETEYGPNHHSVARDLDHLGTMLRKQGDFAGARLHLERSLSIDEVEVGPNHPYVAIHASNIGRLLIAIGDLRGAHKQFKRALSIDEAVYGHFHTRVASRANSIGLVLKWLGDLPGARQYFEVALSINEVVHGANHAYTKAMRKKLKSLEKR